MTTRDRAPPYQNPALHFHVPCPIALREVGRNEETSAMENMSAMLMLRAYTGTLSPKPTKPVVTGAPLAIHTQPALCTIPMAPAWRLLHVARRAIPYLI